MTDLKKLQIMIMLYMPSNSPLVLKTVMKNQNFSSFNHNNWQPLTLELFIDQSGNITDNNTPDF